MVILGISLYFFYDNLLLKGEETSLKIKVEALMDEYGTGETFSTRPPTDFITLAQSTASNGYQVSIYHAENGLNIFRTDTHGLTGIAVNIQGFSLIEGRYDEDTIAYSRVKDAIVFVVYTSSSRVESLLSNLVIALVSLSIIAFFGSFILGYIFARDALLPLRILIEDVSEL